MKIRRATIYDLFEIGAMWEDMEEEVYGVLLGELEKFLASLTIKLYRPDYFVLLAEDNEGRIAGFLLFHFEYLEYSNEQIAFGEHFFIKPDYRGSECMKELLSEAYNICRKFDIKRIRLISIPKLERFWTFHGYTNTRNIFETQIF